MIALGVWLTVVALTAALLIGRMRLDWYAILLFHLTVTYIAPVALLFCGVEFPVHSHVNTHPEAAQSTVGGALLLTFIIGSWCGYSIVPRSRMRRPRPPVNKRLLVGLTVMIVAATIAWIQSFGGVITAIGSIMEIRSGRIVAESEVPWFGGLTKAAWISALLAFAAYLEARRPGVKPAGMTLMIVSALALLLRGSRAAIVRVLIGIFILIARKRAEWQRMRRRRRSRRRPLWPVLLVLTMSAVAVVVLFKPTATLVGSLISGHTMTESLYDFRRYFEDRSYSSEGRLSVLGRLASETSHYPILSTLAYEFDKANPDERDKGRDLIIAAAKLAPASIYNPDDSRMLSYRSTDLVIGRWESQIPPGIVAWIVLTGGPGAFFVVACVILGLLLAIGERVTISVLKAVWWRDPGYIALGLIVGPGINAGSMGDLIREIASIVVVLICAELIGRLYVFLIGSVRRSPAQSGSHRRSTSGSRLPATASREVRT